MTNNKDQQPSLEILLLSLIISEVQKLNWVTKYFTLKILFSHMWDKQNKKKILIVFKTFENHLKSCPHHHFI